MNSVVGYIADNCVSCCQMCNYMKASLSVDAFLGRVEHILTHNGQINGRLFPEMFPDYNSCSNIEKETYGYLAGWCPTCFANFNHGAPFENSEIRAAFEWFELPLQNYDDVVLESELSEDQDQEEVLDQEPFDARADYPEDSGDDMVFTTIVPMSRCLPRYLPTLRRF